METKRPSNLDTQDFNEGHEYVNQFSFLLGLLIHSKSKTVTWFIIGLVVKKTVALHDLKSFGFVGFVSFLLPIFLTVKLPT